MTKREDRLTLIGVILEQAYEDGVQKGFDEGYAEGYKVAKAEHVVEAKP